MPREITGQDDSVLFEISKMLDGMGTFGDPDLLTEAYMEAVEGIRQDCIIDTCKAYKAGMVSNYAKERAPPTHIFANECRSLASARTATENSKARRVIEQDKPRQRTEQEREVMMGRFALLQSALKGDQRAQEALVPFGWKVIK